MRLSGLQCSVGIAAAANPLVGRPWPRKGRESLSRKLLIVLFLCSIQPTIVGNGLLPLLPVYAKDLGAGPGTTGVYLGGSYLALVLGSLAGGWASSRLQRRKLVWICGGALNVPVLWFMGRVSNSGQLALLLVICWFIGGVGLTLVNILAGLFAEQHERGRVFGILAITQGVGALLGGLSIGAIADRWGYAVLFTVLAVTGLVNPLLGLFLDDKPPMPRRTADEKRTAPRFGRAYYLVLGASVIAAGTMAAGRLGTSLAMDELSFPSAAITATAAVAGVISMLVTPLMGRLSDRFDRKILLGACYAAGAAGLVGLSLAGAVWHFWFVVSLISIPTYAGNAVASALVTDVVPAKVVDKGLSLMSAAPFAGSAIGYLGSGVLMQGIGMAPALLICAALALAAAAVLRFMRPERVAIAA